MKIPTFTLGMLLIAALSPFSRSHATTCETLSGLKFGEGSVVSAENMVAGQKLALPGAASAYQIAPLAAPICRVKARLTPVPGSEINVEVWLPEAWNGKLLGTGGEGFSGGLHLAPITLNPQIAQGYAAVATDAGHPSSDDARWAYLQPEKLIDWAYRGNHLTALFAKALIASYYSKSVQRAYFQGCSNGGRDALMEAWRYPQDYDGIIAGAPAAPWTRIMIALAWNTRALEGPPAIALTQDKLKLVSDTVMRRCGSKDGTLESPLSCRFDPVALKCAGADSAQCLSTAEVNALRKIYQGPHTRKNGQISAGWPAGGESVEWNTWISGPEAYDRPFANEFFRWMVYGEETWSVDRFDPDRDFAAANKRVAAIVNADNPDLRPFFKHGGKLILYHGWADGALPPGNTIAYYEAVNKKSSAASNQIRLFMLPGMAHCFGGSGPSRVDWVGALDQWMATDRAPESLIASKPSDPMVALAGLPTETLQTRPVCASPKHAEWNGSGSTDDAANFHCVVATK